MTRKFATRFSLLFAALALLFGGLTLIVFAQDATPTPSDEADMADDGTEMDTSDAVDLNVYETDEIEVAIEPTGDNGYCTICHNQPGRTLRLQDGTLLNLYVAPEMVASSVHGPTADSAGLGCLDCHGEDSFPHSGPPPVDGRVYTLDQNSMCTSCHETHAEELNDGLHAQAIADGNLQAAVCTDCHGAHHIQSAEFRPEIMAGVCGDCHGTTFDQWSVSEHADIGPLGCASCHDYHAQTLRIGETTTDLCLNCHEDNLPDIFAHQTHITEVQGSERPVECADCHMTDALHDNVTGQLVSSTDAPANHSMLLDATPCNTCHMDLISSGEWDDIMAERVGLEAPAEDTDDATETDAEIGDAIEAGPNQTADEVLLTAEDNRGDARFAIQGLLLGLGLGVTLTIVFVTRNRRDAGSDE